MYRCGNLAAILKLSDSLERDLLVFSEAQESGKIGAPAGGADYFL